MLHETDNYYARYTDINLRQCHNAVRHKEHVSSLFNTKCMSGVRRTFNILPKSGKSQYFRCPYLPEERGRMTRR